MDFTERYSNLIFSDKIRFQRICRKLLKNTFIVKEKDAEQRSDYFFAARNILIFSDYFELIGYDVNVDETAGVAMLVNRADDENGAVNSNRLRLKLYESVVLCCLWLIYENKMTSGGLRAIVIRKSELDMEIERLGYNDKIDKNKMQSALDLFESFNLIEVSGKITDYECNIKLFSSLQFCLSGSEFKSFVEVVIPKFKNGKNLGLESEDSEDDQNEQ